MKYLKLSIAITFILSSVFIAGVLLTEKTPRVDSKNHNVSSQIAPAIAEPGIQSAVYFEKNEGQIDPQVSYLSRGNGYTLFLTAGAAVMSLYGSDGGSEDVHTDNFVLNMEFIGANDHTVITGVDELPGKSNYYIGNDASRWLTRIPHFGKVKYEDMYPGIDVIFYSRDNHMEYDFVAAAGANPEDIQLNFDGADSITKDHDGNLVVSMPNGQVMHDAPYAYQEIDGIRHEVPSAYSLQGTRVAFQLAGYDTGRPLVIDPGLTYSTYLGGAVADEGKGVAADDVGNFYVTGATTSLNFPTENAVEPLFIGGTSGDAFVTKYNRDGSVAFSTYWGSDNSQGDSGNGIAVDSSGKIYVVGEVHVGFDGFPTTPAGAAYPASCNSGSATQDCRGNKDFFLTIFDSDGSILYSTYFGGNFGDTAQSIAVDDSGDVYIAGTTQSDSGDNEPFPTKNAAQSTSAASGSNTSDAFVLKISPDGAGDDDLVYSTYISGSLMDEAYGIAVDSAGNAYVTGYTESSDIPGFFPGANVYDSSLGGSGDAFVVKVDSGGNNVSFFTYLGGNANDDIGNGIVVDSGNANVYIVGQTSSGNFPGTSSAPGGSNGFLSKLNSTGTTLVYSRYLGGIGNDSANGIAIDDSDNLYVTGFTGSGDFPVNTFNLSDMSSTYLGGTSDVFITKLRPSDGAVLYSAFYGGSGQDVGNAVAVKTLGTAVATYFTGWTASDTNFSLTSNAAQQTVGGGTRDAFVARIGPFADLSVVINDDPQIVNQFDVLIYTVEITNNGPETATGIVLTVELDIGVTYLSDDGGCTPSGNTLTCNLSNLASGAATSVEVNVTLDTTNQVTATASVVANEADFPDNNTDSEITIASQPDSGSANDSDNSPNPNDPTNPFVIIINPSPTSSGGGGGGTIDFLVFLALLAGCGLRWRHLLREY